MCQSVPGWLGKVSKARFSRQLELFTFQRTCEELLSKSVDYKIPLHYIPSCLIPFHPIHSILFHFTFPFSSMAFHSISFQSMACFSIPFCSIPQVSSMAFFSIPSHSLAYFFQSIPFHHSVPWHSFFIYPFSIPLLLQRLTGSLYTIPGNSGHNAEGGRG